MILVLLGTQDKPFTRLLDTIQECIDKKVISERVVVQAGHTKYDSKDMEIFDLLSKDEYDEFIKSANLLIVHGGVSSIFDGLKNDIPVIAVPRLKKYGEHTNDHQLQIIKKFNDEKYIIGVDDCNKLEDAIKKVKKFKFEKFESNTENLIKEIESFIDKNEVKLRIKKCIIVLFVIFLIWYIIILPLYVK